MSILKNNKLLKRVALNLAVMSGASPVTAEELTSYVDGSKSFLEIKDVNRQSEAWAMCAATFDLMAVFLSEAQPAQSQRLSELANGAEMAVIMSLVIDGLDADITSERFNALWKMAKLAGSELPRTSMTILAAEAESIGGDNSEIFIEKLNGTKDNKCILIRDESLQKVRCFSLQTTEP